MKTWRTIISGLAVVLLILRSGMGYAEFDRLSWEYRALAVEKVATPQAVQVIAESNEAEVDRATRRAAKTFLAVRRFLESRYSK